MTRIGLIADTHHYLDPAIFKHFENCDEIWHAGDFGTAEIADELKAFPRRIARFWKNSTGRSFLSSRS